jgi:hypothetical protein
MQENNPNKPEKIRKKKKKKLNRRAEADFQPPPNKRNAKGNWVCYFLNAVMQSNRLKKGGMI